MSAKEMREMAVADLHKKCVELKRELFNMKMQNSLGQQQDPSKIKSVRRDIARANTLITMKGKEG